VIKLIKQGLLIVQFPALQVGLRLQIAIDRDFGSGVASI